MYRTFKEALIKQGFNTDNFTEDFFKVFFVEACQSKTAAHPYTVMEKYPLSKGFPTWQNKELIGYLRHAIFNITATNNMFDSYGEYTAIRLNSYEEILETYIENQESRNKKKFKGFRNRILSALLELILFIVLPLLFCYKLFDGEILISLICVTTVFTLYKLKTTQMEKKKE